ncbi:MAG: PhnD/SsuA/transferrin family substrate-binding protein [Gammaproteobacteria bacterium]|nr:PhnD/SsuA/transferrin family substrate-binding protein [Gammaproteobacteria bacterium]
MQTASLPMYNLPEIRKASASLWTGIAKYLRLEGIENVPYRLVFDQPLLDLWSDPRLLFSQCCGYDVVRRFENSLTPLAVPHFDVAECTGGEYSSLVVVGEDCLYDDVLDMYGTIAAINGSESHSGMSSLRQLVAPRHIDGCFFNSIVISGAHIESLGMLRRREADVAAIDCVTHALLSLHQPETLAGTRVLGRTYHSPAPPYVTRSEYGDSLAERFRTALFRAFEDPTLTSARQALFLKQIELVDLTWYHKISEIEEYATNIGYPVLQ